MLKLKLKNIHFAWHPFAASSSTKMLMVLLSVGSLSFILPTGQALGHHMRHGFSQGMANYYNNVAAIQSHGRDDEDVCMRGRLTSYISNDCYEFTDEMGNSIEVELDSDVNWELVAKDQLIDLFGEIDRNMFRVKIDAKAFNIVDDSGVVVVSPAATKPVAPKPAVAVVNSAAMPMSANALQAQSTNVTKGPKQQAGSVLLVQPASLDEEPAVMDMSKSDGDGYRHGHRNKGKHDRDAMGHD